VVVISSLLITTPRGPGLGLSVRTLSDVLSSHKSDVAFRECASLRGFYGSNSAFREYASLRELAQYI
jgi:hypothetical protein